MEGLDSCPVNLVFVQTTGSTAWDPNPIRLETKAIGPGRIP